MVWLLIVYIVLNMLVYLYTVMQMKLVHKDIPWWFSLFLLCFGSLFYGQYFIKRLLKERKKSRKIHGL